MHAIKQIKIYAKYWYIAPKASADLSGTSGDSSHIITLGKMAYKQFLSADS